MSRTEPNGSELGKNSFHLARFRRRCSDRTPAARQSEVSIGFCPFDFRAACLAVLYIFAFVFWGAEISLAQISDAEKASYADAVAYCRGNVARPMALSADKRILCFDGAIFPSLDISATYDLEDGGLFVVRSFGGDAISAVRLAEALWERHVTVVVYDYCFSACASYLLIASMTTFVLRDTLVAWHHVLIPYGCPSLEEAKDGGPKRLERNPCADAPPEYQNDYRDFKQLEDWFYEKRIVTPPLKNTFARPFDGPPESVIIRRILRSRFEGTGTYPANLLWTWNPRYYATSIKTKIIYEAYPQSQDEVDAMAAPLQVHVIYDP
jgi:hypothetical protein